MKNGYRALMMLGVFAAVALNSEAQAQSNCHKVHGRYAASPTTLGPSGAGSTCPMSPPAGGCYVGTLAGAGFMSGELFVIVWERDLGAGLTGGLADHSYWTEMIITTKHGVWNSTSTGLFVPAPNDPGYLLQSDIAVVGAGTGRFTSATGHVWSNGISSPTFELSGTVQGEMCL